jgi:muconate cycloisomerase
VNIDRVDAFLVDLPTTHPLQLSMTTMRGQTLLIAQLHNSIHISGQSH